MGTRSGICTHGLLHNGQERWLALSAYGFHTEAVHGQDGYTILRLPGKNFDEDEVIPSKNKGEKLTKQTAKDYVLYEVAYVSARFS